MSDTPTPISRGSFSKLIWLSQDEAADLVQVILSAENAAEVAGDVALWAALAELEAALTTKLLE